MHAQTGVVGNPIMPPEVAFQGRVWTSEEVARTASCWREVILGRWPERRGPIASVLLNHPDAVSLFFALSATDRTVVVLPEDPRSWEGLGLAAGTPLVLPPPVAHLAEHVVGTGMDVLALPPASSTGTGATAEIPPFLTAPGLVMLTSGSIGSPKPVYKSLADYACRWRRGRRGGRRGCLGLRGLGRCWGCHRRQREHV